MVNFTHPLNQVRDFARSHSDVLLAITCVLALVCLAVVVVAVCAAYRRCCRGRWRCRPKRSSPFPRSNSRHASPYSKLAVESPDGSRCTTPDVFTPSRGRPAPPSSLPLSAPDGGPSGGSLATTLPQYQPTVNALAGNSREEHPYIRPPRLKTPTSNKATGCRTPPQSPATTPTQPHPTMRTRSHSLDRTRFSQSANAKQKTASPLVLGGDVIPSQQRTTQSNPPQPTRSRLDSPRRIGTYQPFGRRISRLERSQSCTEQEILKDIEQMDRSDRLRRQSQAMAATAHSMTSLESLDLGSRATTPTRELYRRRPADDTPTSSCPQTPTLLPDNDDVMFVAPKKSLASVKLMFYYTSYNRTLSVLNLECFDLLRTPSSSHTFIAKVSSSSDAHRKERTSPVNGATNPFFFHDVIRLKFDTADDVVSSTLKVEMYVVHFTLGPLHREKKVAVGTYQLAASRDVEVVNTVTCNLQPIG